MKILMVNVPFSGHINPTLVLARELVNRGHEVSYILNNEWKDKIEEAGAKFIPYLGHEDFEIKFKNGHPSNFFKAINVWKYVYNTIVAVGKEYDILIYEFFSFTALSAAKKIGIKCIRQFTTFALNDNNVNSLLVSSNKEIALLKNKFFLKILTKIVCGKIKLCTSNMLEEISNSIVDLNIVYTSKEFQINNEEFDDKKYCFVGTAISKRKNNINIPYDEMNDIIIYISLGTLQSDNLEFYNNCIEAFKNNKNISIIMSVGKNININNFNNIPSNFYIYNFVPQLEVLEKSQIFITHGGMNSVNEGLYYKNKCIVIPMDVDQFSVATRVEELKLGYKLLKEEVSPDLLNKAVFELLEDECIYENVIKISESLHNAGGMKKAIDYIENFR